MVFDIWAISNILELIKPITIPESIMTLPTTRATFTNFTIDRVKQHLFTGNMLQCARLLHARNMAARSVILKDISVLANDQYVVHFFKPVSANTKNMLTTSCILIKKGSEYFGVTCQCFWRSCMFFFQDDLWSFS